MKNTILLVAIPLFIWGCGGSFPAPTQRMADAESAARSARELGAETKTGAQLNLKLADGQIAGAKKAIQEGNNERADLLLIRAKADAELSLALAREHDAINESQKATATSKAADTATQNGVNK